MGYGTKKMIKFNQKCEMLAELWSSYKSDIKFADFFEYNDLGLPLAFMIQEKIVKKTPAAEVYINQTFESLHQTIGLGEVDENLGMKNNDVTIPFKIAFNTLLMKKIINKI